MAVDIPMPYCSIKKYLQPLPAAAKIAVNIISLLGGSLINAKPTAAIAAKVLHLKKIILCAS